ncbi:MAG TPA: endonuclease Q family protein [Methylomirabilota bacterium]|nr:endonuclease Q family protein [Methylomirabilota bacterium]
MRIIADLHIHSKYSRATSRDMDVATLARWVRRKGVNLLGTGDFTHPTYFAELSHHLQPAEDGLYVLKAGEQSVRFMLTVEIANVYVQAGRQRRIHTLVFAPSFEVVRRINGRLSRMGKLSSDGRPMFGFPASDLAKLVLDISPDCFVVPAHAWTPWYSVFGANSGFDSIEECYGESARQIHAIETGLSSDPAMNWRWSALDRVALISNSDAHSPSRIAREANVFECEMSYRAVLDAVRTNDPTRFLFTIEFFPEEGKYHYDGHRSCGVLFSPAQTRRAAEICPVCGKRVTVGVMNRVESLADRPEGYVRGRAIPGKHLVPLQEIIAEALGVGVETGGVEREYQRVTHEGGSELAILLDCPITELARFCPPKILEGIRRAREGRLSITPGYDGVYGVVKIFGEDTETRNPAAEQLALI